MALFCVIIFGLFCLIKDSIKKLSFTLNKRYTKTKNNDFNKISTESSNNKDDGLSQNEILTFEELLEDEEN